MISIADVPGRNARKTVDAASGLPKARPMYTRPPVRRPEYAGESRPIDRGSALPCPKIILHVNSTIAFVIVTIAAASIATSIRSLAPLGSVAVSGAFDT